MWNYKAKVGINETRITVYKYILKIKVIFTEINILSDLSLEN